MGALDKIKAASKEAGEDGSISVSMKFDGKDAIALRTLAVDQGLTVSKIARIVMDDFLTTVAAPAK